MRYALNTVPINGNQTLYGYGVADITVTASGFTNKQKTGVSTAALSEVLAVGAGVLAKTALSNAEVVLDADGEMTKAVPAYSSAVLIDISARHGIPNPVNIPSEFNPTHGSRVFKVQREDREIQVYAESNHP